MEKDKKEKENNPFGEFNQLDPSKAIELSKYKNKFFIIILFFVFANPLFSYISHLLANLNAMNIGIIVIIVLGVIILLSIKQINQYERGVKFTIWKYVGIMNPGWRLVIPVFQSYQKVDMRVRAVEVPDPKTITKNKIFTCV